jgi:4-alpha-glucanotransferase
MNALYDSKADWVIVPMQDILFLGGNARMNMPGTATGNWEWRMKPSALKERVKRQLSYTTRMHHHVEVEYPGTRNSHE